MYKLIKPDFEFQIRSVWLALYLLMVFGLAWSILGLFIFASDWTVSIFGEPSGSHPLFILAVYAPAIATLIIISMTTGTKGLRGFLSRLLLWRASLRWYAFLILGFPIISFTGAVLKGNVASAPMLTETVSALLPLIGFMLILGPMEW